MEQHKKEWYNPQKMLSYNQFLNFVIGGRDIGKTFAIKIPVTTICKER